MSWPLRIATLNKGGAGQFAPYPAPAGYRWTFVTYNGERVTYAGSPVVALIGV